MQCRMFRPSCDPISVQGFWFMIQGCWSRCEIAIVTTTAIMTTVQGWTGVGSQGRREGSEAEGQRWMSGRRVAGVDR